MKKKPPFSDMTPDVILVSAPQICVPAISPDVRLNTRVLRNPFNVKELNPLWGGHPDVIAYIKADDALDTLLGGVTDTLDLLWQQNETTIPMTVLSTCKGGFHRSVAVNFILAEELWKELGFYVHVMSYRPVSDHGAFLESAVTPEQIFPSMKQLLDHARLDLVLGLPVHKAVLAADVVTSMKAAG
jgi:hypothetical protein